MTLTPEQIANWRAIIGVGAAIMTDDEIIAYKDNVQSVIDTNEKDIDEIVDEVKETPKKFRIGLCVHNVSAKHCRVCK